MKDVAFKGEISQFWGKPLSELATKEGVAPVKGPLAFSGVVKQYENIGEIKSANDYPSDEEVVKFRNTQKKANERQKAMQAAVIAAGLIQPTTENDPQLRLEKMYQLYLDNMPADKRATDAGKLEARNLASTSLGIAWADED